MSSKAGYPMATRLLKLYLELKGKMLYKLSRLQLRTVLVATLFNKHILSATVTLQNPIQ